MATAVDPAAAVRRTPWVPLFVGALCNAWTAFFALLQFGVLLFLLHDPSGGFRSSPNETDIVVPHRFVVASLGLTGAILLVALGLGLAVIVQGARGRTRSCWWLAGASLVLAVVLEILRRS